MNVFVQREGGKVIAVFANFQAGFAEEELTADHHEVVDFLSPKPSPLPRHTAMWRARAISKATPHGESTLFNAVVSAISEISEPTTKAAAEEAWERGTTFDLDGQLVPMLAAAVRLTEADVLDLIALAEQLPA